MAVTTKNKILSRKTGPRKALMKQLSRDLIVHKCIRTTVTKAKAVGKYIAPLITRTRRRLKTNPNHAHRKFFDVLRSKQVAKFFFDEVLPKVGNRAGGYTRVIKSPSRRGDGSAMAFVELVDFNDVYSRGRKTKVRRSRKKKTKNNPLSVAIQQELSASEPKENKQKTSKT